LALSIHCEGTASRGRLAPGRNVEPSNRSEGVSDRRISLALCGLTPFVDGIVSELVRDVPYAEITARLEPGGDLLEDFERSGADLMICALRDAEMDERWRLALSRRPPPAVLNIADDPSWGRLYSLEPRTETLETLSGESLRDALLARLRSLGG
jgi:DNA-binding transcriptional LysR family regulator